jgi:hypothetical protein
MSCCDEYCDNYGCNQGRDCPVRRQPVKVAKIGRKDHAKAPLPASPWRAYLRHLASAMLLTVAVMLVSAIVVGVLA